MLRSTLSRGVSVGALTMIFFSSAAATQEALPTIDIDAERGPSTSEGHSSAGRERTDKELGYSRAISSSATKTSAPILDTPRSIVVIPHQVLNDTQVLNVQDAVKFVSGVQQTGAFYDSYLLRGFTNSNSTYRNNLKLFGVTGSEDVSFVDRVEIVKGPVAMLFGRVQPGGLVNFVTKKPEEEPAYSVQEQFGSWGLSRTTVDVTGPIDKDKTLLYRVIGVYDHADDFIDFRHRDNGAVYGALSWRPTMQFDGDIQIEYYNNKSTNLGQFGQQIPAMALSYRAPGIVGRPADLPRNWTQNDPSMFGNFPSTAERILVYGEWTYRFDDAWKVTNRFHYARADEDQEYILYRSFNLKTGDMSRRVSWTYFTRDTYSLNLDFSGELHTGPVKHNLLLGFDYFDYHSISKGDNPQGPGPEFPLFNVFAPVYGGGNWSQIAEEHAYSRGNILSRSKQQDFGYYIQDDISYEDSIHLLLGGRYDVAFDASAEVYGVSVASGSDIYGPATPKCFPFCDGHYSPLGKGNPTERKFSPNAGLLFKPTPDYSLYSSYSQSFANSNATSLSFDGTQFKPEEAWQFEIGGKASLFGGRITGSIAAFELHRTNVLSPDPVHVGFMLASGEVRSRGVEADLAGKLTDNVSVIGSYTYDDAIIIRDTATGTAAQLGKRWPGVPRHAGNLWAKYDTAPGQKDGWTFGAGFYAVGLREGNATNSWALPGYVTFDAMLGRRTVIEGLPIEAQLNVRNIGDAKYFEASSGAYANYGAPRTFIGSVKVKF
ncbi:TonB-dependent siderophore receptor [Methylosinus sp. Sm6]|uniref:TonB-dependent siderophore receptor n=1 Tax=Methylosinus sp. Sm6 TaxID=2866948 RepID=UPI001C995B49|nr:TonB-dependent receptor [Methylosinus sp. Sm6]MBY6239884.1 TonB-dependent receptor [Methylosinus sp. Sm6]